MILIIKGEDEPMIRKGTCSECGGLAEELWYRTDWWHRDATDCAGRKIGEFITAK